MWWRWLFNNSTSLFNSAFTVWWPIGNDLASISILFSPPRREIIGDICLLRQKIVFLLWKCILECRKALSDCARKEQRTCAVLVAFSSVSRHHFPSIECATKEHRNPSPRGAAEKLRRLEKNSHVFGKISHVFQKKSNVFQKISHVFGKISHVFAARSEVGRYCSKKCVSFSSSYLEKWWEIRTFVANSLK